ncbi:phytanoyl-CoA dioxygenase family protein [Indioceanicola profundi]|uniref:phytanoyl-CoA dioxygenase family protein n=1 Tax=Indioceanicola profundi TaxID=2220096 RepID=UPI000E6AE151|nr:phytanoyl-CoA dioxygenase family protein [Indioceanicola profundi]
MTPENVLSNPPRVLSQKQREFYFENGYLLLERIIPDEVIDQLRRVTAEVVKDSRSRTRSDHIFDLEPTHTAEEPRLRRLSSPVDYHPYYWEFCSHSILGDIVADLVGTDVKFHHSKLNFKWARGGAEVKWHQDIQFWPHTNYSPLTVGTYLYDCGMDQGPLAVIPRSHSGELFDQYGTDGNWTGFISDRDLERVDLVSAVYLPGPAGSITIHNCRTVHGSRPNESPSGRPLLLHTFSSADAMAYTPNPIDSPHSQEIIRGKMARYAHHDPRPCQVPPDWSGGYKSIFHYQQRENKVMAM